MGSRVKQGELLADIDTPEIDQELMQVRANRQQIVAQMDLAKINADRYVSLRKTDSVSQQESDQQSSAYQQAKANLDAADATVRRLEQLESFKHVYAPFSGAERQPASGHAVHQRPPQEEGAGAAGAVLLPQVRVARHRAHAGRDQGAEIGRASSRERG